MVVLEPQFPRDKHATISVILHRKKDFATIDNYLQNCEEQFEVEYIKPMYSPTEQTWEQVMSATNAHINNRGKNIVLECLQFGGNTEFWDCFANKTQIARYFQYCYAFAVNKIGYLHTDKNIICAVTVIEKNRRNLFVYYLPITEKWQAKVMTEELSENGNKLQLRDEQDKGIFTEHVNVKNPRLSHTEFWTVRGGPVSYSNLQESFYTTVSKRYGAQRGKSYSLIKNTCTKQQERFGRYDGDQYDELYYDDSFW